MIDFLSIGEPTFLQEKLCSISNELLLLKTFVKHTQASAQDVIVLAFRHSWVTMPNQTHLYSDYIPCIPGFLMQMEYKGTGKLLIAFCILRDGKILPWLATRELIASSFQSFPSCLCQMLPIQFFTKSFYFYLENVYRICLILNTFQQPPANLPWSYIPSLTSMPSKAVFWIFSLQIHDKPSPSLPPLFHRYSPDLSHHSLSPELLQQLLCYSPHIQTLKCPFSADVKRNTYYKNVNLLQWHYKGLRRKLKVPLWFACLDLISTSPVSFLDTCHGRPHYIQYIVPVYYFLFLKKSLNVFQP